MRGNETEIYCAHLKDMHYISPSDVNLSLFPSGIDQFHYIHSYNKDSDVQAEGASDEIHRL